MYIPCFIPFLFFLSDELSLLQHLDLSNNNMLRIPEGMICSLHSLDYLNLTRNKIHDIIGFHFSASPSTRLSKRCGSSLKQLDLSTNNIDNLPAAIFSGLGKLTHLRLDNNKMNFIADRALEGLLSLSMINLSDNHINSLPPELFNEARNVQQIYLQNNSINVLAPGIFTELTQLLVLDLSHNELTSDWVNAGTLKRLKRLIYLDVSYNQLDRLEVGLFQDVPQLEILKLQDNRIEHIGRTLSGLTHLHTLVLSNNHLHTIDEHAFTTITEIQVLSLDYNRISIIDPNALRNCTKLQDLHLNGNKLERVPDALLAVPLLKTLDLGENLITDLTNASFMGMYQMFGLRLTENNIEVIQSDIFKRMVALQILNLSRNRIKRIDTDAFENNTNLQAIRLDGNYLREMAGLFVNLPNLVWLNISDNQLEVFDYAVLPKGLKWLDIHANKITELGNYFEIESQLSLSTLDASSNQLTEIAASAIPNSVEVVYLNDNLITKVQSYTFFKKPNITRVDLFGNRITTLDPNALRISAVPDGKALPEFFIGGNPFQCDCNLDWLQRNNSNARTQPALMDVASIYCKLLYNRGKVYVPLVEAMSNQFLCKYDSHCTPLCHCCDFYACDCKMECPAQCTCYHDQSWQSNVVDCSKASYSDRLPDQIPMDASQIYLDGNKFSVLNSHSFIGRKKLRILFLNSSMIDVIQNRTFNGLTALKLLHLGQNRLRSLSGFEFIGLDSLRELYLQQNQLISIENNTFSELTQLRVLRLDANRLLNLNLWALPSNSLTDLRLADNPWACDCDNVELIFEFIKHTDYVKDKSKVRCVMDANQTVVEGFLLYSNDTRVTPLNRCANYVSLASSAVKLSDGNGTSVTRTVMLTHVPEDYVPLLIGTVIAFLVTILACLLIFVFLQEVRVWFHSHFGIRLFYHNTDEDKNEREKLFDAFISYSSKDEAFVAEQLAPILENGDTRYMLCLHYRDFPVGAYIADTIVQAIESSRRTIMVLSENFIKSEWCRFEFKSAHHQVLRDRRRRLIVILLGDVPQKDLDPDIRLYLKTNTYLQWGDKFFWDKLRFALPDVPNNQRNQLSAVISASANATTAATALSRSNLCHHVHSGGNAGGGRRGALPPSNICHNNGHIPLTHLSGSVAVVNNNTNS